MLRLLDVSYRYPGSRHNKPVIASMNGEIRNKEFLSLVGPSGCGKTTLVNLLAGHVRPTQGEIQIDGLTVVSPGKDRIVIHQENDIFEWMTVAQNMNIVTSNEQLIERSLVITHLDHCRDYYPRQLSGGMKKRLSLARALAADPKCIIMDEPFSSLDSQLKVHLHEEVLKIVKESGKTVVLVTHDIDEALFLSDRILVLSSDPMVVKAEVYVPFGYPRDIAMKDTIEFMSLKKQINHLLSPTILQPLP